MDRSTHPHAASHSDMQKLNPLRSRTDPGQQDQSQTRNRLRNALPGSIHTHRHQSHKHRQSQSHRHAAKETVQSAFELKPPISFEHLLRRDKRTPESSRRNSGDGPNSREDGSKDTSLRGTARSLQASPQQVEQARQDNEEREKELKDSLQKVEELGMQSTRQLDETYYSLLEKAEILRQTVNSMQSLAQESRAIRSRFQEETSRLCGAAEKGMDSFESFTEQERAIQQLVQRLEQSQSRTEGLNGRIENAKQRAEACEKKFHESQAKMRKQWGVTWASIAAVLVLVFALLVARHQEELEVQLEAYGRSLSLAGDAVEDIASPLIARLRPSPSEDPFLQDIFAGIT